MYLEGSLIRTSVYSFINSGSLEGLGSVKRAMGPAGSQDDLGWKLGVSGGHNQDPPSTLK